MISPLELRGPEFLTFYAWMFVGSVAAGMVIRYVMRGGGRTLGSGAPPRLDTLDIAYLRVGPPAAFDVSLIRLMEEGVIERGPTPHLLRVGHEPNRAVNEVERALINVARNPCANHHARAACEVPIARIGIKLMSLGLVGSPSSGLAVRFFSTLPLVATFALGIAKIVVGVSRGKPVGYLLVASLFCVFLILVFATKEASHRTRAGDKLFNQLLKATDRQHPVAYGRSEADSYALRGKSVLTAATAMMVSGMLYVPPPPVARGSGSWGGGGCGGSSCGGSCGSSCGGGGCGGCGGS